MEDYIFVEGKRYISAKQASIKTGYTSDYIGQMAREGRLNSKKIGRVRFVSEDQLKSYTVDSDRKKQAIEKMSAPQTTEYTDTVQEEESREVEPKEVINIESHSNQDRVVIEASTPTNSEKEQKANNIDFGKIIDKTSSSVSNAIKNIDLKETKGKALALALALLIVFGPYTTSETGVFKELTEEFKLAYEAAQFDVENIAIVVYDKTKKDGVMRLVTDSLAFSEMELKNNVASAIFTFAETTGFIKKIPRQVLENSSDLDITPPAKALKASVSDSLKGAAQSVYEWFYIRQ